MNLLTSIKDRGDVVPLGLVTRIRAQICHDVLKGLQVRFLPFASGRRKPLVESSISNCPFVIIFDDSDPAMPDVPLQEELHFGILKVRASLVLPIGEFASTAMEIGCVIRKNAEGAHQCCPLSCRSGMKIRGTTGDLP